jgi:hypothetical protein
VFFSGFEEIGKESGPGYTLYVINMTSQKWKSGTLITMLKEGREVMVFNATIFIYLFIYFSSM